MTGPVRVGRLSVRLADPMDAAYLGPRLRPWDMVECFAGANLDPVTMLMRPFSDGFGPLTWTLEDSGEPIAMGGLYPFPHDPGAAIWLLGTEGLDRGGLALLALSRPWVAWALESYSPLCNMVPARAEGTIRWLRWVGFDIDPAIVHFRGVRFLHFRMDRVDGPNSAPAPRL